MKKGSIGGRARHPVLVLFICLLGLFIALVSPTTAAEPVASVEIVGDVTPESQSDPLEVQLPAEGRVPLTVSLLVREAGPLRVEYTDLISGAKASLPSGKEVTETGELLGSLPEQPVAPGDVLVLRLELPSSSDSELKGLLSIRTGANLPLVREVVGAATPAAPYGPTQAKVEIEATRLLPFMHTPTATQRVGLNGGPEDVADSDQPLDEALVTVGNGGSGRVLLEPPATAGKGPRWAELKLKDGGGVGTATTSLDLGSEGKAEQKLEVVVKVGDSLLFPVIVIILGALLGKLAFPFWEVRRQARLMQAKLKESYDAYAALAARRSPKRLGLESIRKRVGSDEGWPGGLRRWFPRAWGHEELRDKGNKSAGAIYYRLGRARSKSALESATEDAADLISAMAGWSAVREALMALAKTVKWAEGRPSWDSPESEFKQPLDDSNKLLEEELEIDSDISKSEELAKTITMQEAILKLYVECIEVKRGGDPDEGTRQHALRIYLATKSPLLRGEEEAERLVGQLQELLYPRRTFAPPSVARLVGAQMVTWPSPGAVIEKIGTALIPTRAPSPAAMVAGVRFGDWLAFFFALLIASLAFLLPVYSAGPFGTFNQYLAAFVAGAGAQVVVDAALIPLARSYKAAGEETKAEPEKAAA